MFTRLRLASCALLLLLAGPLSVRAQVAVESAQPAEPAETIAAPSTIDQSEPQAETNSAPTLLPAQAPLTSPDPAPAAPEAVAASPASVTVAPPTPTSPATFSAVVAGVPIRLTGTLHAMVEATQGVQSFDTATAVAPTSALNPAVVALPDDPNLTFQVQQTRLGMILGEGSPFRGQVEIDFTHFDQSSPTAQAYPRIRIALLEWTFAPNQRLFLGQTWDIFGNAQSPQLLSHSFNLVGTLFRAGNIGFMRHQLGWSGRFGDLEVALAAGLQGSNAGPAFNNVEESLVPTGSARLMLHVGDASVIGISGIASGLRFTQAMMPNQYRAAVGGELFADLTLGPLSLRAEAYVAQNLANMGALNLGFGRYGHDVLDAGGYISGRLNLGEHAITAMFGGAGVLNPEEVVPGYTTANAMGTPPTTLGALAPNAGPGMLFNLSAHAAYWYSPVHGLSIVLEPYVYITRFKLDPADAARFAADRVAFGGMLGSLFQF